MKHFFNFKGTIHGVTFFIRTLLTSIFLAPLLVFANIIVKDGMDYSVKIALLVTVVLSILPMWLYLSTVGKRINTMFPNNRVPVWVGYFLLPYVFSYFIPLGGIIVGWGFFFYLVFANSKVEKHNG